MISAYLAFWSALIQDHPLELPVQGALHGPQQRTLIGRDVVHIEAPCGIHVEDRLGVVVSLLRRVCRLGKRHKNACLQEGARST